jgi:hypothetical protein
MFAFAGSSPELEGFPLYSWLHRSFDKARFVDPKLIAIFQARSQTWNNRGRQEGFMQSIQTFEKATTECARLRIGLVEFEKRVKELQVSLHNIELQVHSNNCQSPLRREDRLITGIEEVLARIAGAGSDSGGTGYGT